MTNGKLMKSTKVKPCPFCGKIPMIQRDIRFPDSAPVTAYEVICRSLPSECIISYVDNWWYRRKKDAIEAWNRRANPWHTGTPTEDGDYLCVFDDAGFPLYGWCVYSYGKWGYLSGYDPNVYHMVAWQKIEPFLEASE